MLIVHRIKTNSPAYKNCLIKGIDMGLILGIAAFAITVLIVAVIIGTDAMSDAPSQDGVSPVPALVIGMTISAALIITHFYSIAW